MTVHDHVAPSLAAPVAEPAPVAAGRARSAVRGTTVPAWALEAAVWLGIVALGAAVRWPNLWLIPTITDETGEALRAIAIYRGEIAPLTNVDGYIGAFWNYALAAGFWTFGLSPWLPRLFVFVAGVLTVGAAYWLGRELGGRVGGVAAGLFMAACSTHALVNSHVGWSHSTTPLWATLGLACLARAAYGRGMGVNPGPWLVASGLLLGLAVQTHVTALLLIPGAGLALLIAQPRLLRTRWMALAVLTFLIATANLLVYNVETGGGSLLAGRSKLAGYTGEEDGFDADDYVGNVWRLTLALSWVLSGAVEKRRFVNETLAHPLLLLYLGVTVGGLLWAARRRRWLPLLAVAPYLLILPVLNPKYEPMLNGRYLVPALPLMFAGIGLATADLQRALRSRWSGLAPMLGVGLAVVVAGLALYPLVPMQRYVQTARTNHAIFAAYETVLAHREPGEVVLVDYGLDGVFFMAAGSAFKSMELLLSASDVPYAVIEARPSTVEDEFSSGVARLAVLNSDRVAPLGRSFAVTPLMPGGDRDGPGFGVYRLAPRR